MSKSTEVHAVAITPKSIIIAIGIFAGIYFLFLVQQIVVTLFLAVIMMAALNPAVKWLERKLRIPRPVGIIIVYLDLIFFLAMTFLLIIPPLVSEIPNLVSTLSLPPIPDDVKSLNFTYTEISTLFNQLRSSLGAVYTIIASTFSGVFGFFTVLVMTAYLLLDRENLHKKVAWFTKSTKHHDLAKELVDTIELHLGGWVRGQLLLMLIIGVITYIGLRLLAIPYALPLALLAGLLEILPNLGPTIAALPAIGIAFLMGGPAMGVFMLLFYVVVQQLENNLIVPKIMKDNVDVNPLTTILVILIGLKLAGVMGALLGVPVYIVVRSVYSLWLREYGSLLS